MESKLLLKGWQGVKNRRVPFNRTSMESKHDRFADFDVELPAFNRTSMESKPNSFQLSKPSLSPF